MAVVRGWTEPSPARKLGSFTDSVLFPLSALPKREWVPLNASAIKALGEERAAIGIIYLVPNLFSKDNTQPAFRLLPDGCLHRDFAGV